MPEEPLRNFFLQFGDDSVKRISYAPSIGHVDFPLELSETISRYLSCFSAISVRESSAVSIIENLGYNATPVLDPTMLLCADDYLKLAKKEKGRKCVFIYSMNYESKEDIPFDDIQQLADARGLPIIVTPGSGFVAAKELFKGVEYSYATIPQWIMHIANAELVVTASFHGVVFAILFHRSFIYTPLKGQYEGSNKRVLDLLECLALEKQIYTENNQLNEYVLTPDIWKTVDIKLKKLVENSKEFLLGNINE
jgi:hypothetical protein